MAKSSTKKDFESNQSPSRRFLLMRSHAAGTSAGVICRGLVTQPLSVLHSLFLGPPGPEVSSEASPVVLSFVLKEPSL